MSFSKFKKNFLCGVRYLNNEWLRSVVEAWLEGPI